jgi:cytochrome c oxidase subunit 3
MAVGELELEAHREGHAAHEEAHRPAMNQLGLWFFFLSECFLFAALLSARLFLVGFNEPREVNQALGLTITMILIASSFTAYMSECGMARGDRAAFLRYILATMFLGAVFAGGVAVEWSTAEFSVHSPYGTAFFSMTGLHASHVISGVFLLGLVALQGSRGHYSKESHWGVEAAIKYWHFVDVVWVFFYPALYLITW